MPPVCFFFLGKTGKTLEKRKLRTGPKRTRFSLKILLLAAANYHSIFWNPSLQPHSLKFIGRFLKWGTGMLPVSVQNAALGAFILDLCVFRKLLHETLLLLSSTVKANEQVRLFHLSCFLLQVLDSAFLSLFSRTRPLGLLCLQSIR